MPRTASEPMCNLTLSRSEWSVMIALLNWAIVSHPRRELRDVARGVQSAVQAALKADQYAADVAMYRESDKWAGVLTMLFPRMGKVPGGWALYDRMRNQIQASETEF